ncbi:unnamed protein product [Moneuplotes crassus]|uniref:Uncharacterized protein n=1 Tax=Euplotes crassus TaxID=5936 RepID=A0AAD1XAB9_EUPCR|nr:unnamed protein product [Moneuplotes crassus]
MERHIDIVMRVGSENMSTEMDRGKLKIKQSSSLRKSLKIDLVKVIEEDILPKVRYISLRDLSILFNGLILVFSHQQHSSYSEIQDIHDTLICPMKSQEDVAPKSKKATTRKRIEPRSKVTASKFIASITQLLSRRHFLMLNDPEAPTQSVQESQRKRYSNMSSAMNNRDNPSISLDPNPEMDLFNNDFGDQVSFSVTQRLQDVRNQLNLDLHEMMRNEGIGEENDLLFSNLDITNPEISNLLRTPPTRGTQLQSFRHEHDLRNQFDSNENSSQNSDPSMVGDSKILKNSHIHQMVNDPLSKMKLKSSEIEDLNDFDSILQKNLKSVTTNTWMENSKTIKDKYNLINPVTKQSLPIQLQNSAAVLLPADCISSTIREYLNTTTSRKMRSNVQGSSGNNFNTESNLLMRNNQNSSKHIHSANDAFLGRNEHEDQRYDELEQILNNEPDDLGEDILNFNLDDDSGTPNEELFQRNDYFRAKDINDYITTQGTFHCQYISSYNEINEIIQQDSKKRSQLISKIDNSTQSQGLPFSELLIRFKKNSQANPSEELTIFKFDKADKANVFMNLLHLKRQGKVQLRQDNVEEFGEILVSC